MSAEDDISLGLVVVVNIVCLRQVSRTDAPRSILPRIVSYALF